MRLGVRKLVFVPSPALWPWFLIPKMQLWRPVAEVVAGGQNEIMRATLPGTQPGARKPFPGAILTLSTIAKAVWEQNGDLLTQAWMLSAPATERTRHRLVVGRTTSTVKNRRAPAFSLCIWLLDWTPCLNTLPPKINNSNVNNDRWLLLSTYYMPGTILSACMCYLI